MNYIDTIVAGFAVCVLIFFLVYRFALMRYSGETRAAPYDKLALKKSDLKYSFPRILVVLSTLYSLSIFPASQEVESVQITFDNSLRSLRFEFAELTEEIKCDRPSGKPPTLSERQIEAIADVCSISRLLQLNTDLPSYILDRLLSNVEGVSAQLHVKNMISNNNILKNSNSRISNLNSVFKSVFVMVWV